MKHITYETATQLAYAHREIKTGEKMLAELSDGIARAKNLDYRDAFGQRANIQLQVPQTSASSGSLTSRLFDIKPEIALAVVQAHIAECRSRLDILTEKAKAEMQ